MKQTMRLAAALAAGTTVCGWSSAALADNFFESLWDKTTFNGLLRTDVAYSTTPKQNPYNQQNVPFATQEVARQAYLPPALSGNLVDNALTFLHLPSLGLGQALNLNWTVPIPGFSDTIRRADEIPPEDATFHHLTQRFQGEMDVKFTDSLRLNARLRALWDPEAYELFDARDVAGIQDGISSAGGDRYADVGKANLYEAKGRNGRNLNPLELAGRNYMIDLPTLILEWKQDNYALRLGNQQIAWGQAIFFRTFDVANGLDYRRHLILDRAIEEYEDERVAKLALRGTMQLTDSILVDAFVGKFQPDVLPNPNTPYNVIPSQFYRPLDNYFTGGYDKKLDFGIRFKADYGDYALQAIAVSRYNPLGTFRWAEGGTPKGLYGGLLGSVVEIAYMAKLPNCGASYNPSTCRMYGSFEEAISHTPFSIGPGGVYSDLEWYSTAASVRLNAVEMVNAAINEFPALQDIYAYPVENTEQLSALLNTFFMAAGDSIRGNVQRDYHRESVFGIGGTYVTAVDDPDSFFDSIILNLEVQYTPERVFTARSLSRDFLKTDEYIITAVAEKWHRWSADFPAAYLVAQYMHRSESDLVGLHLSGYGGNVGDTDPKLANGIANANYLVFAGFQPTPNRKFIFEWAFLYDVKGGLLFQPNVRWNPGNGVSFDLFYNFVDGRLHGDGTDTLHRAIDFADEITLRFTYTL